MDSKHLKRCKHPKKMKASTNDGNAEVFVLPPDLLKKLGIQLGNVSHSHGSDPNVAIADVAIEKNPVHKDSISYKSKSTYYTSNSETVNLMKKSVLLSPTFVSTVANVFPGEIEIASIVDETDAPIEATEIDTVNRDIFPVDVEITNTISEPATATKTSVIINPPINDVFDTVSNSEHNNRIQINNSVFANHEDMTDSSSNTIGNVNSMTKVDDNHLDGENVMNFSNNNSKHPQEQKSIGKINIISEEIIGPSKLKGLKRLPTITALTPVTIDTYIGINNNNTAHELIQNSLELSESKLHGNEVLIISKNLPTVNTAEEMLNEINKIDGDVTQYFPEEKMCAVTNDFDNNSREVFYNVVKPNVPCHTKSFDNSSITVNSEEACDGDSIASYVTNNSEKNDSDTEELTCEGADINSFENEVYADLNKTVNKLQQNVILYADEIMEMDVDGKTRIAVNTTLHVKQDANSVEVITDKNDSVVKLNLSSDHNKIHDVHNSITESPNIYCLESNTNNSNAYKGTHDSDDNMQNGLEHQKECEGKSSRDCEVLCTNKNAILTDVVDDISQILKQKRRPLNIVNGNESVTSSDTESDKMVSLVTYDYQALKTNNIENPKETVSSIENNLNMEIDDTILCNGTAVTNGFDNYTHQENNIQAKGCVLLPPLNNVSGSDTGLDNPDTMYGANRDAEEEHKHIDLEVHRNINCVGSSKALKCDTVYTENEKFDHCNNSDCDHNPKNISNQTFHCTGGIQQDNRKHIPLNINKDSIDSSSNSNKEKVNEIAEYLKILTYSGRNKLGNKNNKLKSIESNPNTIKSKLSVLGVEKPGGNITKNGNRLTVLKTYQRPNRLKNANCPSKNEFYNAECMVNDMFSDEKNTTVISADTKTQEFCVCNDFGRLDYYECDDLYEHIHFCQHHNTNCDLDLLFNIYNDVVSDQKELNNDYITDIKDTETVEFNICWNALQYRDEQCCIQRETLDKGAKLKHELIDNLKDCNPNLTNFENNYIISAANKNSYGPSFINAVKESRDIGISIHSSEFKNPGIMDMEQGNAIPSCDEDIHNTNLNNLQNSVVSCENIQNSDNLNMNSKSGNVPQIITIKNEKSEISTNSMDHNMDYFGDNVIDNGGVETEITKQKEHELLEASVKADETINYEYVSELLETDVRADETLYGENLPELSETDVKADKTLKEEILDTDVKDDETINYDILLSMMNNEPTAGEEENLLDIKNKRLIQNPKGKELTSTEISFTHLKRRWQSPTSRNIKNISEPAIKRNKINKNMDFEVVKNIKCAVCHETFTSKKWEKHVIWKHQFIAWKEGDDFDLDNAELLKKLRNQLQMGGFLKCTFCNVDIDRLKKFIKHVRACMKLKDVDVRAETAKSAQSNITCGVCKEEIQALNWFEHIGKEHNYLAWVDGLDPLDLDDDVAVREHMRKIVKKNGELNCCKCGYGFKYSKLFLAHVASCTADESKQSTTSDDEEEKVTCGVCKEVVSQLCWVEHIAQQHNYLAWHDGKPPLNLDDEEAVWNHLQPLIRVHGGLTCHKCGFRRKRVKLYLDHIKICEGKAVDVSGATSVTDCNNSTVSDDWNGNDKPVVLVEEASRPPTPRPQRTEPVPCGRCKLVIPGPQWIAHIGDEHQYMAWEDGSPALNVEDEEAVRAHLEDILKETDQLVCNKCGTACRYVKGYLEHLRHCLVVCGVCKAQVLKTDWLDHMTTEHDYIAWIEGQTPIDIKNDEEVVKHLYTIIRLVSGFICPKCGMVRKYAKTYWQHVKECKVEKRESVVLNAAKNNELVECAVCHEKMDPKDWKSHALGEHYNIAWVVGEPEVDIKDYQIVDVLLKEYEQKSPKMACKLCGAVRLTRYVFYSHVLSCGKSQEELKEYMFRCEICNKELLFPYKAQHMGAHRTAQRAERRAAAARLQREPPAEPTAPLAGRRRAAEKAKIVLKKYTNDMGEVCDQDDAEPYSDSDESVNLEECSEEDSGDTDVDSDVSDEDLSNVQHKSQANTSNKQSSEGSAAVARVQRIPFTVSNPRNYLKRSGKEFIEMYWSKEELFPQWNSCEYEVLNEQQEAIYLPPIEESCKIKAAEKKGFWRTFKRFEACKKTQCSPIFVGAIIRCIAWAPMLGGRESCYLAVVCHLSHDEPRQPWDRTAKGPALIQIWDYGDMQTTPQLALCAALEGGAVWAADWCPSGARDPPPPQAPTGQPAPPATPPPPPPPPPRRRLGLLAAACSDGFAYIFSVPYPATIKQKDRLFYKLKPVAKLKLTMSADRKVYPATSLKWSPQKPHNHVIVGYADGTIAYYDLNTESPILKVVEDNVTTYYPYYDERFLNSSIEGVDMYPSRGGGGGGGAGAVCGACVSGGGMARAAGGGGARRGAARAAPPAAAAAGAAFLPHWPSAVLFGDDFFLSTAVSEVEWWGGGRRFGGARAAAGCVRCGRAALATQRLLRLHTAHPSDPLLHKLVVGIVDMVPFDNKRKRKQNDDLSMVVEPTSYEDAVKKYGVEYEIVTARDRASQKKVTSVVRPPYPERFPLAEMTSLAFCTSEHHHDKLAVAVHAGFVLIVSL